MYRLITLTALIFLFEGAFSQASTSQPRYLTSEENLQAIANLSPNSPGGYGFDNRYEGIRGTPRLMDTLLPSLVRLHGQDYNIQVLSDIDLVENALIYQNPKTKTLYTISADVISELTYNKEGQELIFNTTFGKNFDKEFREQKFYQVLKDGEFQFIKIPLKNFVEANYKGAYSADRRYDEYVNDTKYYLMGTDGIFHQVKLNKRSVSKLFPDKKKIIDQAFATGADSDKEDIIISLLDKF